MPGDKARAQANARLSRLRLPEIPAPPTTKQERAAARVRRMGLVPVCDQQQTTDQEAS
ncbi:hypothetical protein [Micromonospora sp. C41]|uniref:hypothetical protein n=1 Tax=Micromonospora sp. C41 TaxID=2824878 RepID=UPI001B382D02|nr:hypothetical protein [Micromonospora sp. C41]MBQ1060053.1 hypothetical protein [Micromonospora sp. C41]